MAENIPDKIIFGINQANDLYHRLVIVVSQSGNGKTAALQEVHRRTDYLLFNLNLELCQGMLELTSRQRSVQLPQLMMGLVNAADADVVLFDNTEILFDVSLKQDPLRLLQGLSRNKTVVVAWNGSTDAEHLVYATLDHPEYKEYSLQDLLIIMPKAVTL
jgi:hypothetical protein